MSYPPENRKGSYVFIFWAIFNLGGVIGSLIPLGQNIHRENATSVADGTYIAFLILTVVGACLASTLLPVSKVRRVDGTKVIHQKNPTFKTEMIQLGKTLWREPWMLLLFPMFFASNWFYTYEQSDFAAPNFNVRSRSLNSLLFWLMQMIGAYLIGLLLDYNKLSRKSRGMIGWVILFCITHIIWGCGYRFDKAHPRDSGLTPMDFKDSSFIGPMFLYMFYGFYDAIFQCYAYWVLGALTNSSRKLAIYAGWYKGIQSAGAAIAWAVDDQKKLPQLRRI
ncbi:unnamed protein product [Ambrosiozyma monospora]|uniref:Unnamed protein product n=1 Tax=Ambrosiozyma monospora TaxID=43982 RepID=A0ACB5TRT2_AMBMO|nr:unnamed protein product [Ambrosiozyma monospora]